MSCNFNFDIVYHWTKLWVFLKKKTSNRCSPKWCDVVMKMDVRHQMACLWGCSEWWASRTASPFCHHVFTCVKTPGCNSEKLSTSTLTFQIVQMCSLLHQSIVILFFCNDFVCVHIWSWSTILTYTWIYM